MANYFQKYAQTLYEKGYSVIPLVPNEKKPVFKKWQDKYRDITQAQLNNWLNHYPDWGVGVQTFNTPAIDIDVKDAEIAKLIVEKIKPMLGDGVILIRVGQAPKILIPCQLEGEAFDKITGKPVFDAQANKHQVEILCDGQQFVAFGYHKDAQKDYHWTNGKSLLQVKPIELSLLSKTKAYEIIRIAESCYPDNWKIKKDGGVLIEHSKTSIAVPKNLNINQDANNSLSDMLKFKLSQYRHWLNCIPATIPHDEWKGVLMALHKEGKSHKAFYHLGREWSKTAGTAKGGFDESAQKALPPEPIQSSVWKSFKNDDKPNAKEESYILRLYHQYCPQAAMAGFTNEEKQPLIASSEHQVMTFH